MICQNLKGDIATYITDFIIIMKVYYKLLNKYNNKMKIS